MAPTRCHTHLSAPQSPANASQLNRLAYAFKAHPSPTPKQLRNLSRDVALSTKALEAWFSKRRVRARVAKLPTRSGPACIPVLTTEHCIRCTPHLFLFIRGSNPKHAGHTVRCLCVYVPNPLLATAPLVPSMRARVTAHSPQTLQLLIDVRPSMRPEDLLTMFSADRGAAYQADGCSR